MSKEAYCICWTMSEMSWGTVGTYFVGQAGLLEDALTFCNVLGDRGLGGAHGDEAEVCRMSTTTSRVDESIPATA